MYRNLCPKEFTLEHKGESMLFKDIPQYVWFKDGHGRKMIRLQNVLPSGLHQTYARIVHENTGDSHLPFNAIDINGISCNCPDHVEFTIVGKVK